MTIKAFSLISLVAVLLAGCSSGGNNLGAKGGGASDSAGGITFAFKPKIGESATYAMKMSIAGGPQPMTLDGTVKVTNKDAGSGNVDIETTSDGLPGGSHTTVQTIDPAGKVLKFTMDGKPGDVGMEGGASTRTMMPTHPVKVGDTWTGTQSVGGKSVSDDFKLDKVETTGGVQLATVEISKIDMKDSKLSEPAKVVIEPATGTLHSMSMKVTATAASAAGQSITITMEKK